MTRVRRLRHDQATCRRTAQPFTAWCCVRPAQELGEMAYAAKGQDALAVQAAKLKQDNYAEFLFSKEFQPLGS